MANVKITPEYRDKMYRKYQEKYFELEDRGILMKPIMSKALFTLTLQDVKEGKYAQRSKNPEKELELQKKNPIRFITNRYSRATTVKQVSYFMDVEKAIKADPIGAKRLEAEFKKDVLIRSVSDKMKNPNFIRQKLNTDEAFRDAYIKALNRVKKPGTEKERTYMLPDGTVKYEKGEASGLTEWLVPDTDPKKWDN